MQSIAKNRSKFSFFLRQKRTWFGGGIFLILLFVSMTAELWSGSRPLLVLFTSTDQKTHVVFPIFQEKESAFFEQQDSFLIDYKAWSRQHPKDLVIFPFNQWDPLEQTNDILAAPSAVHRFGTDSLGRDIFARLLYGVRISLGFSMILWMLSYGIGAVLGAMQGYFLGAFDFLLERFKELETIIPVLTMVVLVTAITKSQSFWVILFLVMIFSWINVSSQVRATVLSLRSNEYCHASSSMGAGHLHVIFKHILPNSMTPVITLSPFAIESGISILAALDYLGFGLPPPTPSLGELMAQGRDNLQNAPWVLIAPVVTILLLLISISLIGQALRDAFDPKLS